MIEPHKAIKKWVHFEHEPIVHLGLAALPIYLNIKPIFEEFCIIQLDIHVAVL
jgi:hypothetical protein